MGVIKPLGEGGLSDSSEYEFNFIASTRYSPPEFITRNERNNKSGWRAVTFYQLGTVIYELIERKRIFTGVDKPQARLHQAILKGTIRWNSGNEIPQCFLLAKQCLQLIPERRIKDLTWDSLRIDSLKSDDPDKCLERIKANKFLLSSHEQDGTRNLAKPEMIAIEDGLRNLLNRQTFPYRNSYEIEGKGEHLPQVISITVPLGGEPVNNLLRVSLFPGKDLENQELQIIASSSLDDFPIRNNELVYSGECPPGSNDGAFSFILKSLEAAQIRIQEL